jgi:alpha-L-fucosidase
MLAAAALLAGTDRVKELQDLKWGMFVCWSFSTFSDKEWTPGITDVSFFHPTGMDTDQWARVAKEAGMGYILFLTKHHDGFCLWDTETTQRKVTRSPLEKDVLAAVRKSCDKYGLKLALYFSEGDWTWPDNKNPEMKKAQLKELLTRYGPIEYLWLDHAQTDGGLSHEETFRFVKSLQPRCFVGFNHGQPAGEIRIGEMGGPGPIDSRDAAGPYATPGSTYEIAEFAMPILGDDRWFYTNPKNDQRVRSPWMLLGLYQGTVRYGNLFSLDVGPGRDGRLRPIDERVLLETGKLIRSTRCQ